ncbi:hypothetical protein AB0M58_14485 [Streptomyces bobili]|uniref:hypothetical protein n=1 Tax=Streptomyces bobili TaxID=67280 RepID=UPI0034345C28
MTDTARLTYRQASQLITALQHGQALDDAVATIELTAVWTRARTDTRLAIALAGRDPDAPEERSRTVRADFLRLLALGLPPSRAELILGVSHTSGWRSDSVFAGACDAVTAAAAPYGYTKRTRLSPQRVAAFLKVLSTPGTTVLTAAAAAGVTPSAIYQKRRRDKEFARAYDAARRAATSRG